MYNLKGRLALFTWSAAWTYQSVTEEKGDTLSDAIDITSFVIGSYFIFAPFRADAALASWTLSRAGLLARGILMNPYAQAAYVPYVAGLAASKVIDPVSGVDNFLGFTTGGALGNPGASPMAAGNDYFNFSKNIGIIGSHYYASAQESAGKAEKKFLSRWEELKRDSLIPPRWAI